MKRILTMLMLLSCAVAFAQEYRPKNDGVATPDNGYVCPDRSQNFCRAGTGH